MVDGQGTPDAVTHQIMSENQFNLVVACTFFQKTLHNKPEAKLQHNDMSFHIATAKT